jgi:hypothetical protein
VKNHLNTTLTLLVASVIAARAQEHPAVDLPLHEKFYSTWYMPDQPSRSCCNKADCYPTLARWERGQWWALRREDGKYIPVPPEKLETRRDNPDGRSHLCAPSPKATAYPPETVFCFALGGGT